MKKKIYEKPSVKVVVLKQEPLLQSGSGNNVNVTTTMNNYNYDSTADED